MIIFLLLAICVCTHLAAPFSHSIPIWSPSNTSAHFVYLRSPPFTLPGPASSLSSATLLISANPTPNLNASGIKQPHLLGAFTLFVNGVPAAVGPGRPALGVSAQLAVTALDVAHLLRDAPASNVLAVAAFFTNAYKTTVDASALPRVQLELACALEGAGDVCNVYTSGAWQTLDADPYHNAEGDSTHHSPWYHVPNEDLNAGSRVLGWETPGFVPTVPWTPAAAQPPFPVPLYVEAAPSPDMLWRPACSVQQLGGGGGQLVDFGQQLNGGVNLSFVGAAGSWPAGTRVKVLLGEELSAGGAVVVPARSSVNYTALWTLDAAGSPNNVFLTAHEFIQFRYAQVIGSPVPLTADTAQAWVIQHAGGNPFAAPACARSLPFVLRPPSPPVPPLTGNFAAFSSSSSALDEVFRFTAFTAVNAGLECVFVCALTLLCARQMKSPHPPLMHTHTVTLPLPRAQCQH